MAHLSQMINRVRDRRTFSRLSIASLEGLGAMASSEACGAIVTSVSDDNDVEPVLWIVDLFEAREGR